MESNSVQSLNFRLIKLSDAFWVPQVLRTKTYIERVEKVEKWPQSAIRTAGTENL